MHAHHYDEKKDNAHMLLQGAAYLATTVGSGWYFLTKALPICRHSGQCLQCAISVSVFLIFLAMFVSLIYFAAWVPSHRTEEGIEEDEKTCSRLEQK